MSTTDSTVSTLQFVLDGTIHRLSGISPTTTVLNYLRETMHRTGTKEGCAEGDCGACTVVVGELHEDRIRLRAVNACIQLIGTLHGKAIFTVELLTQGLSRSSQDQTLHPAQQAMINSHGSQCGFCTPGFVMSLFALYKTNRTPTREQIHDHLSGNLCRCTGYKPIVQAAHDMYQLPSEPNWLTLPGVGPTVSGQEQALIDQLQSIRPKGTLHLTAVSPISGEPTHYLAPTSADAFAQLLDDYPDTTVLAGGTDVGLWVTKQHRLLHRILYLGNIPQLQQIIEQEDTLRIGAGVTLTDAFERLNLHYPNLSELWRRFSSVQVRNAGTLGGNIANGSPIGDSMPILITLGSYLTLRRKNERRDIALSEFYLDYQQQDLATGEFVEWLHVPKPVPHQHVRSYKLSKRFDQDISAVCAAFNLTLDGNKVQTLSIAFGGMAATPKLATHTMQQLQGSPWDEQTVRTAMADLKKDFTPLTDMRASAEYRMLCAQNLLYRFYLETCQSVTLPNQQTTSLLNVFNFTEEQTQ